MKELPKNTKLVCISNYSASGKLTINKIYNIIRGNNNYLILFDDCGVESEFSMHRFITIAELREKKLKRILK